MNLTQVITDTVMSQSTSFSPSDVYNSILNNYTVDDSYLTPQSYHKKGDNPLFHSVRRVLFTLKTKNVLSHNTPYYTVN